MIKLDLHRGLRRMTSKKGVVTVEDISSSVHAIILAGGPADNPLARYRAMPSVELGAPSFMVWRVTYVLHLVFVVKWAASSFPRYLYASRRVLKIGVVWRRLQHTAD